MEYRELEVMILSAQNLKNVRLTGGVMSPYAEVWIYSSKKVQTGVDTGGGAHPSWNSIFKLACEDRLFRSGGVISVAVYNHGSMSNKLIGTATVPLSDLSAQCKAADESQGSSAMSTAMSYQIRKGSGKARGVLNLAVKVGAIVKLKEQKSSDAAPVTAYPAAGYSTGQRNEQYYPPQYHAQYGQPAVYYQQPAYVRPQRRRGGPGMGLGAGLLGGLLLGSALDGGGGCGGGCGG